MSDSGPTQSQIGPKRAMALGLLAFSLVFLGFVILSGGDNRTGSRDHAGADDDDSVSSSQGLTGSAESLEPKQPDPIVYTVQSGDSLGKILNAQGLTEVEAIRQAALEIHDLADIQAGKKFTFELNMDGEVSRILYPLDGDDTLAIILDSDLEGWRAEKQVRIFDVRPSRRNFSVESTLWDAAIKAGLQARDIVALANVYRFDIDFNTEVQAGAEAQVLVDELWENDEFVKLGPPQIARFTNAGESYLAIRYQSKSGKVGYYDEKGQSRKKAFLRSPLGFNARVTSSFNPDRFHPILKKKRPHNGTDYGAPTGTRVIAVADGTVTHAGRNGGHGNYVKIDHPGPYASSYSHLSKISVKKGQKVRQGSTIGKVGSSGLATGPHLHYQFWVRGKYVDPLSQRHASTERLPKAEMVAFQQHTQELLERLNAD